MDRTIGIGGSDIGIILGVSKWKTPVELYLEKIGETKSENDSEWLYWGNVLEEVVAREYSRRNNVKIKKSNKTHRHPEFPFLMGHIDRFVVGSDRILECKTTRFLDDSWGESGSEDVPTQYFLQCQTYMEILKREFCDLAVLVAGSQYKQYTIKRDRDIGKKITIVASEFWDRVQKRNPPPSVTIGDVGKLYKYGNDNSKIADLEIKETVSRLHEVKEKISELEKEEDSLKQAIGVFLSEATYLLDGQGKEIATFKNQSRSSIDSKLLRSELPEIAEKYTKTTESRILKIKGNKK